MLQTLPKPLVAEVHVHRATPGYLHKHKRRLLHFLRGYAVGQNNFPRVQQLNNQGCLRIEFAIGKNDLVEVVKGKCGIPGEIRFVGDDYPQALESRTGYNELPKVVAEALQQEGSGIESAVSIQEEHVSERKVRGQYRPRIKCSIVIPAILTALKTMKVPMTSHEILDQLRLDNLDLGYPTLVRRLSGMTEHGLLENQNNRYAPR